MLTSLKKWLNEEKKDNSIFDIVLYGSSVKGKENPADMDIAVIFRSGSLKDRLSKVQLIKRKIKLDKKIDIKGILLEELFKPEFFARSGIFLEGMSIFDGKYFSEKIGFSGFVLFNYFLTGKTHTEKVKFNYVLSGRKEKGIVSYLEGKQIAPCVVKIPIKNSLEFEEVLKKHKISYSKMNVLIQD